MAEPVTYQLKHPLEVTIAGTDGQRNETIREVQLRRLKGRDLRVIDEAKGPTGALLAMISRSSGLTLAQVDDLDVEDVAGLGEVVEDFLPAGLLTGATPSET